MDCISMVGMGNEGAGETKQNNKGRRVKVEDLAGGAKA